MGGHFGLAIFRACKSGEKGWAADFLAQAKKKRLTVTWSTRLQEVPFWAPFDAVFDSVVV
jgi:hypothetical protein